MAKRIVIVILIIFFTGVSQVYGELYYPHFASNDVWETEIALLNASESDSITGTLNLYGDDGTLITQIEVMLPPRGRKVFWGADLVRDYSSGISIGYLIFSASSDQVVGYLKFYDPNKYSVAIAASPLPNNGEIFIPHVASTDKWATGVSVVNTTDEDIEMCFEFDTGITKTKTVAAKRHEVFFIKSLFDGVPQPKIGAAKIRGGKGIVGLILFSNGQVLDGIPLDDHIAHQVYYPHLVMTNGWNTGIVAYNTSYQDSSITIYPFATDGTPQDSIADTINGARRYVDLASNVLLTITDGWAKIIAARPLSGFELFAQNKQIAGYKGPHEGSMSGILPKIEQTTAVTGVVFVNDNDKTIYIDVYAYDDEGNEIDNTLLVLGPYEKRVSFVSNLFSGLEDATYLSYESEDKVVVFQMNAFANGEALDSIASLSPPSAQATLTSIEIIPGDVTMKIHETCMLGVYGLYSDGTIREITDQVLWISSDDETTSVENSLCDAGMVTGREVGSATISAHMEGKSNSASVAVEASNYLALDYFPLVMNSWWLYESETGEENRTEISGQQLVKGISTLIYQFDTGTKQYFTYDAEGIKLHGMYYISDIYTGNVFFNRPILYLPKNIQVGQVYQATTTASIFIVSLSIKTKNTIIGVEDVISRDTVYRNCVKISYEIEVRYGSSIFKEGPIYFWLSKGIGTVKAQYDTGVETVIDYYIP